MQDAIAIILGGGRGKRLFPLTHKRSKPAVPFGGKYRLIDVPVSACLSSGLRRIFVLTQFNSESLNKHVARTYQFDVFSEGFVSVLAAEQTEDSESWFQGTADAVRRSMRHIRRHRARDVVVLAGDQLYRMDLRAMLTQHRSTRADATVAVLPVSPEQASAFGILRLDGEGRIVHFEEKPSPERLPALESDLPSGGRGLLASMGIYAFERKALEDGLTRTSGVDFGRDVIPDAVARGNVRGFVHDGYWQDLGTIRSYFDANLALTEPAPPFDFYDARSPVFTDPLSLPASKFDRSTVSSSLVGEGCVVIGSRLDRTVVGIRSRIGDGCSLRETLLLGADWFEAQGDLAEAQARGEPPIGVGEGCQFRRVIVDKNARIGRHVRLTNESAMAEADIAGPDGAPMCHVRDGIIVVPKGAVVPDGTVI